MQHELKCLAIDVGDVPITFSSSLFGSLRDWAADGKWFEDPKEEVDEEHQRLTSFFHGGFLRIVMGDQSQLISVH